VSAVVVVVFVQRRTFHVIYIYMFVMLLKEHCFSVWGCVLILRSLF